MHAKRFLHKLLASVMHKKRLNTLSLFVETALLSKKLSLTELGREASTHIQERSGIRRADRFLGNAHLKSERRAIIQAYINKVLGNIRSADIIVDWSMVPNSNLHILRAALAAKGRAITLYEEVHDESRLNTDEAHNAFLLNLKELLPNTCKPTILTDGGFHNAWFRAVQSFDWDYIGRIRVGHGKKYRTEKAGLWLPSHCFNQRATQTPTYFGRVFMCKKGTLETNIYLYKGQSKSRTALNKDGSKKIGGDSKRYRGLAKEPWILASSLSGKSYLFAKRVIKKYQRRMQIEEGFRDLKSTSTGLSFRNAYSKCKNRIEILLLIALLASFLAWLVGFAGERRKIHYLFQSNSTKGKRVLSLFFLGCRIIKQRIFIPIADIENAIVMGLQNGH